MIGTIVNTVCIVVGTLVGTALHKGVKAAERGALDTALGLASLAIGLNATISNFPKTDSSIVFIVSIAIGAVVGTKLDIDGRFKRLVNRKHPSAEKGRLAEGLSTAILLYCIGPLSMLGPVLSALP